MVENILFNLTSALEALSHEINQVYRFYVDFQKVQIDHRSKKSNEKNCLRCLLESETNDYLTSYLNCELPRRESMPKEHWYNTFVEYRNQVMHRILYLIMLQPGRDFLPDDPSVLEDPKPVKVNRRIEIDKDGYPLVGNHIHRKELRIYSRFCFTKVLGISEEIYRLLEAKVN